MLALLSFLQVDFLSVDCARASSSRQSNFYIRVIVTSLFPIGLCFVNIIAFIARALGDKSVARVDKMKSQHFLIFLLYLFPINIFHQCQWYVVEF